jgi:hypothetical protein
MKKALTGIKTVILISVLLIAGMISYTIHMLSLEKERTKIRKTRIGEQVVIGKDTTIVLKYNSFSDTYTLSNGTEIDSQIIEKK